jgi:hypothetical protein
MAKLKALAGSYKQGLCLLTKVASSRLEARKGKIGLETQEKSAKA